MSVNRIDTHHHVVPSFYREWLQGQGISAGGKAIPAWETSAALDFMDLTDVRTAIVSVSTPGVNAPDPAHASAGQVDEARSMARRLNEYCAELRAQHPERFGFFATVTLPDVEGAVREAAYALDELDADGIVVMAHAHGKYLGHPDFRELLDELDRRGTVLFVHPAPLPEPQSLEIPAYVADFLLDTTRTALDLVQSGALERLRNLRIVLSHGGGFIPYAAARMAAHVSPDGSLDRGIELLRRFYVDTALSASPYSMPSLLAFADPSRILYGSDYPYASPERSRWFTGQLDAYALDADTRHRINRGNAEALFPRLATVTTS